MISTVRSWRIRRLLRKVKRQAAHASGRSLVESSALNLGAVAAHRCDGLVDRRYLNMELLKNQQMRGAITVWALEPVSGIANPNRGCEDIRTPLLPRCPRS
jgi:hypothetical protein